MKRKLLSLACCLAICLSLFVPAILYQAMAEDTKITGATVYSLGPVWDPVSNAVDGNDATGWHSQYAFDWGVLFVDLGADYDLSKIDLLLPDACSSTSLTVDMLDTLPTSDLDPNTNIIEESYDKTDGLGNGYYLNEMPIKRTLYSGTLTTAQNTLTMTNGNGARYLRVKFTGWTATNKNVSVNEIAFYGSAAAEPPAGETPVSDVTVYAVGDSWGAPDNAADGSESTEWHTKMQGWGVLFVDLGAAYDLTKIDLVLPGALTSASLNIDALEEIPLTDWDPTLGFIDENHDTTDGHGNGYYLNDMPTKSSLYAGTVTETQNTLTVTNGSGVRYLRVKFTSWTAENKNTAIEEITFYGSAAAEPPAGETPVSDVTVYAVGGSWGAPDNAVDGNESTEWHTQMQGWGVLFVDLGAAYDLTKIDLVLPGALTSASLNIDALEEIPLTDWNPTLGFIDENHDTTDGRGNGYYLNDMPTKSSLYAGTVTEAQNTLTVTNGSGVRYLRVKFTSWTAENKNTAIEEITFYGSAAAEPPAEETPISDVTVYAVGGSWGAPDNAVDGNESTEWHTQMQGWGVLFVDLGRTYDLTKINLVLPGALASASLNIDALEEIPLTDWNPTQGFIDENHDTTDGHGNGYYLNDMPTKSSLYAGTVTETQNTLTVTNGSGVRYLRVKFTSWTAENKNTAIEEITFYGSAAAEPVSDVTVYAVGGSWGAPDNAVDGNESTEWHTQMQGWGVLFVDLGRVYDLTKINLVLPGALTSASLNIDALEEIPLTDWDPTQGFIDENHDTTDGHGNGYYLNDMPTKSSLYAGTVTEAQNTLTVTNGSGVRYLRVKFTSWTAENKNTAIEEITFYGIPAAEPSHEAGLSSLKVNGTDVADFAADRFSYDVTLPVGTTAAAVTAVAKDSLATVDIDDVQGDPDGKSATVTVTAEDGTTVNTYTIRFTVEQPLSNDASLKSLQINGTPLAGFKADVYAYTCPLSDSVTQVTVTAEAVNAAADVQIQNVSGTPAGKTASVKVTAADGVTTATYTITFRTEEVISVGKKAYSAVSHWEAPAFAVDGKLDENKWHACFDWGILYIDLGATYDISRIKVQFPSGYLNSQGVDFKVQILDSLPGVLLDGTSDILVMPSGDNSPMVSEMGVTATLYDGNANSDRVITDEAVSGQGRYLRVYIYGNHLNGLYAQLYEVTVYGALTIRENDASLTEITVDGQKLSSFNPDKLTYSYPVTANQETQLTVGAVPMMKDAKVEITQTGPNPAGKQAIIKVTALDGVTVQVYTINFVTDILVSEKKSIVSIGGSYDKALQAVDGDQNTQWHSMSQGWGGLFLDLGEEYELSTLRIVFPDDYNLGTETVQVAVDAVSGIPGPVKEGCLVEDGDRNNLYYISADSDFVTAAIYSGTASSKILEAELNGVKTRYVRLILRNYTGTKFNSKVAEWQLYAHEPAFDASLSSLKVNGEAIKGFDPEKKSYFYELGANEAIPTVSALPLTSEAVATVTQATTVPGQAVVRVVSADRTRSQTYYVNFVRADGKSALISYGKKTVTLGNTGIPGYTIDGNLNSVFRSAGNEATVFLDLGGLYHITRAQIIFEDGSTQNWAFTLDKLSAMPKYSGKYTDENGDALCLETLYDGSDASLEGNEVVFYMDNADARYVRLHVLPNSSVETVGIRQIQLYGYAAGDNQAQLKTIRLDGKEMTEFRSPVLRYYVDLPYGSDTLPVVSAEALNIDALLTIRQADADEKTAVITVTSSDGTAEMTYEIVFVPLHKDEELISAGKNIFGSSEQAGQEAAKALDGDLDSLWAPIVSNRTYTLTVDLGGMFRISRVLNQNYAGNPTDAYNLVIDGSMDGKTFTRVYNSNQDVERGQNLNMVFDAVARYIRISYFGINGYYGDPISVSELKIYGYAMNSLIEQVMIDGKPFEEFNEGIFQYNYVYSTDNGKIPQVSVKVPAGVTVKVEQAASQSANAVITVTFGEETRTYVIRMCPIYVEAGGSGTGNLPATGVALPATAAAICLLGAAAALFLARRRRKSKAM